MFVYAQPVVGLDGDAISRLNQLAPDRGDPASRRGSLLMDELRVLITNTKLSRRSGSELYV